MVKIASYKEESMMEEGSVLRPSIAELLPTLSCEGPLSVEEVSVSPTTSHTLARLLAGEDVCMDARFHGQTVRLCGCVVLPSAVLASHSMRTTFLLVRQTLNDLQSCLEDGGTRDGGTMLSQQCAEFLTFLECLVHRYLTVDNGLLNRQQVAMELLSQLCGVCGHLGPLEDQLRLLRTSSPCSTLHHLSLQLHWSYLAVHYRLTPLLGAAAFVECASRLMSSCLNDCAMNFDLCPPPFLPCPCLVDLWTLLRRTLDSRPTLTKGFWELLSDHLLPALHPPPTHSHHPPTHSHHLPTHSHPPPTHLQDGSLCADHPVVFVWWVLCRLALLDKPHPLTTPTQVPANNWSFVVEHLLQHTFSGQLSEVEVRVCLVCAVRLVGVWGVCPQLVFKAWDYTHKHMNDPASGSCGLEWAPTRESTTPKQWLNHIVMVTERDVQSEWSSFELFLSMLSKVFGRHGNSQSLWKQLKGRVYSKVHRRWVSELSGCGLARVTSLYLVLSSVAEHAEVGHKMVATFLALSSHGPLVWKGLLTLVLLCLHHHRSVSGLVDKLTPALCNLVGQLSSCDSVWDTIATVLVGSAEAIEMPGAVNLGACNLIGSHFSTLLSLVEGARLTKLLSIIETLGTTLSSLDHPPSACCRGYLEHCILPLPSHTPTPPHTLHSIAATGTLLAIQWSGVTGQRSYPQRLFTEYGCKDSTHAYVSSGYLCHVMPHPLMARELLSSQQNQLHTLHTWLRCLLASQPLSCDSHVTELTRLLPRLPLVASLTQESSPTEPLTLLRLLLSHMCGRHCEGVGSEWREGVETILGDLLKIMTPSLHAGPQAIKKCYGVGGVVVSSCPQIIYSRINSRCLFPQLVDCLVLPLATSQTPSTHNQASCIRTHLHYFIEGLLCLDPDDFIKRKLRALVCRYFLIYCTPSTPLTSSLNPFKTLVERWTGVTVSEQKRQELIVILDIITAECLQLPQQPASLLHVLVYMREMVEVLQCPQLMASVCVCLFPSLLPCLLACDVCTQGTEPRGIRRQVMSTLRPLLQSCDSVHTTQLVELLRVFVSGNKSRCDVVMTTLSAVLPLHPPLTTPTLRYVQHIVRGNQTLTNTFQQFNAKLAHLCK